MKTVFAYLMSAVVLGSVVFSDPAFGQDRQERLRYLDPLTEVSDDPRRIPVPPGDQRRRRAGV